MLKTYKIRFALVGCKETAKKKGLIAETIRRAETVADALSMCSARVRNNFISVQQQVDVRKNPISLSD